MYGADPAPLELGGKLLEEIEDPGFRPLVLAERLVVHEEVSAGLAARGEP